MMHKSNKQSLGFTLIELVMVIVILGILAAVAIPKFVDLSGDATTARNAAQAGSAAEAANIKASCEILRGAGDTSCAQ